MKKNLGLMAVTVCLLVGSAAPARANIWDWMQEWSGPGPFHERIPPFFIDYCDKYQSFNPLGTKDNPPSKKSEIQTLAATDTAKAEVVTVDGRCFYTDYRDLENSKDPNSQDYDNFPIGVRVKMFTFGLTQRVAIGSVNKSLSAGAGAGLLVASGRGPTGKTMVAPYIDFPRLVAKPLLLIAELNKKNPSDKIENLLSVWQVHFSGGVIIGPFDAEDLGVDPSLSNFHRKAEFVTSRGVLVIDAARLLRAMGVFQH